MAARSINALASGIVKQLCGWVLLAQAYQVFPLIQHVLGGVRAPGMPYLAAEVWQNLDREEDRQGNHFWLSHIEQRRGELGFIWGGWPEKGRRPGGHIYYNVLEHFRVFDDVLTRLACGLCLGDMFCGELTPDVDEDRDEV